MESVIKKNVGTADAIVRILLAVVVGVLYFVKIISGTLAIVLGVVAIVFLATSFLNFCPIYAALGIKTSKE